MQQVNSGSAGGKRRGSTTVNLAPQQSPPVYHHQPQQQPFQQPVTTELITPTLSPESTTRPGTAGPGPVNPGSQGRHPFPTKQTTPYTLHTTPVQTCAPPNTSQYHSAQKHFLSSLYLKDDPHDCLLAFHRFTKHDDENNNGGVTLAQLINMPLLGTTETCLHVAIKWGKPVTVKALLRLGANPRLRSGFTCQVVPCPGPMGQGAAGKKRQAQSVSPPPELNVTSSGRVTRKRKINYNEIVSSGKEGSSGGGGGGDEEGSDRARGCCLGCLRIVEAAGSVNNSGVPPALTPLQLMALYPGEWGDVDSLLLQDVVKGLWVSLMDRDSMGRTCLHLALGKKKHSGSSSNSEDDDDSGASNASAFVECIVEAIENLDSEMSNGKQMLSHFLDAVDCEGNTALHLACLAGDLDSVKALVRPDSKEDVVTATIGIINMFSQTPLDLVVEMALETVRKLGLYEDEMLTCLRSVKYLEDEGLFRRELVCKLGDGSLMMGEKEELQFRVRRMMLVEGVDGFSIQQLVKLREIARVLLSANGNSDVSSLEDWFDAVLLNRL
ncbi:hypothetical protein HDU99_005901 [Rhizoclosmatium hyalinum]|nr:hypothetical protein HDU99_005901 [Rhizoclosmatium hyalinum]